jgi:hypothetical protein
VVPLVAQGLAGNVVALCNRIANALPQGWHIARKLHCKARYEPACVAYVAAAAREEEAGRQTLLVVITARDRPCDGRLARACQPAQPEDAPLVLSVCPAVYLAQEVDARVGEAGRLVLLGVRVERRIFGVR